MASEATAVRVRPSGRPSGNPSTIYLGLPNSGNAGPSTSRRPKIDRQRAKQHEQELKNNENSTSPIGKRKRAEEETGSVPQLSLKGAAAVVAIEEHLKANGLPTSFGHSNNTTPAQSSSQNQDGTPLGPKKRRRNRNKNKNKTKSSEGTADEENEDQPSEPKEDLHFFEDDQPNLDSSTIHHESSPPPPTTTPMRKPIISQGLLLPVHVILEDDDDMDMSDTKSNAGDLNGDHGYLSEESDIQYIDTVETFRVVRYFDDPLPTDPRKQGIVCSTCGEFGHKRAECTRIQCLKCGTKDDHDTRSCPMSITCFNCGTPGHISADCSQRRQAREDCFRCGSRAHFAINCPSLWRIYTYNSTSERHRILDKSEAARHKTLHEEGGEVFIGSEIWCYYCGRESHWGDDCQYRPRTNFRTDPSIFSEAVVRTGPFANSSRHIADRLHSGTSVERSWEKENTLLANPGKKEREARQRKQREQAARDSGDEGEKDWFANRLSGSKSDGRGNKASGKDRDRSNGRSDLLESRRGSSNHYESRSESRRNRSRGGSSSGGHRRPENGNSSRKDSTAGLPARPQGDNYPKSRNR